MVVGQLTMTSLTDLLYNPPGIIWPLLGFAVAIYVVHQIKEQLNPIITGLVAGLAVQAKANAGSYGVAILFGLSASLAAFYDVFSQVDHLVIQGMSGWQFAALVAKVLNPFIVAFLATLVKMGGTPAKPSTTTPPFPTQAVSQ